MNDKDPIEPFLEDEVAYRNGRWTRTGTTLSSTGLLWVFFPYGLFFSKKITYSIIELWLFVVFLSITIYNVVAPTQHERSVLQLALVIYLSIHISTMSFVAALYQSARLTVPPNDTGRIRHMGRIGLISIYALVPLGLSMIFHYFG